VSFKAKNGIDLGSVGQITNLPDPTVAQNAATKNYTDTTTAGISYGGWGDGDSDLFGDLLSTFPRTLMQFVPTANHLSIGSVAGNTQQAFLFYNKRAFTSTGIRYLTGGTAQSGQTTTATVFAGASLGSLALLKTVSVAFSATNSLVQTAWGSSAAVPVGWVAVVFTSNTNVAAPAQLMTAGQVNPGGTGFTAPSGTQYVVAQRSGTTLANPTDFTTGWTSEALVPWISLY
jgi:hypothetical protein